jgi:hypothetical protein
LLSLLHAKSLCRSPSASTEAEVEEGDEGQQKRLFRGGGFLACVAGTSGPVRQNTQNTQLQQKSRTRCSPPISPISVTEHGLPASQKIKGRAVVDCCFFRLLMQRGCQRQMRRSDALRAPPFLPQ